MKTIILPQTQPKVKSCVRPRKWKPGDTKSMNKFFDLVHREATKHFK